MQKGVVQGSSGGVKGRQKWRHGNHHQTLFDQSELHGPGSSIVDEDRSCYCGTEGRILKLYHRHWGQSVIGVTFPVTNESAVQMKPE